jgi:hypothetical protein
MIQIIDNNGGETCKLFIKTTEIVDLKSAMDRYLQVELNITCYTRIMSTPKLYHRSNTYCESCRVCSVLLLNCLVRSDNVIVIWPLYVR